MRRRALALALGAVVLTGGCGIGPQDEPEDLDVGSLPSVTATPTTSAAGFPVRLWFLREDRLVEVRRSAPDPAPDTALDLLAEGPTPEEAREGLTTAVSGAPTILDGPADGDADGVVTVDVPPAFTGVAGDDQLRAVAQVVWTVTEFDGVDAVRFTTEDEPLEVPTDQGLSDQPVDRDDYASLAPAEGTDAPAPTSPTG